MKESVHKFEMGSVTAETELTFEYGVKKKGKHRIICYVAAPRINCSLFDLFQEPPLVPPVYLCLYVRASCTSHSSCRLITLDLMVQDAGRSSLTLFQSLRTGLLLRKVAV